MNIYYAGVGSRETPREVLNYFSKLAYFLASNNYIYLMQESIMI